MLDKKIQDAIRESLPEKVAGELKDYIQETEHLKEQKEKLGTRLDAEIKLNGELIAERDKNEERDRYLTDREHALDERELEVQKQERNLKIRLLEREVDEVNKSRDQIFSLVETIFKNETVKRSVYGTKPMVRGTGDGYTSIDKENYDETTETTVNE